MRKDIDLRLNARDQHKIHECFLSPSAEKDVKAAFCKAKEAAFQAMRKRSELETSSSCTNVPESFMEFVETRFSDEISAIQSIFRGTIQISWSGDLRTKSLVLELFTPKSCANNDPSTVRNIAFQRASTIPLLTEMEQFVASSECPINSELVFGITLLVQTAKAFVWKGNVFNQVNCRMQSMRLAGEIHDIIVETRKLENDPTFAGLLAYETLGFADNLIGMIHDFRKINLFDMYKQSLWVASSAMSNLLSNAQVVGLLYLGYQGIFASFLHAYNMMVAIGVLEKIEIVEDLCELFLQQVFMGLRPRRKFSSKLFRFSGAKLTHLKTTKTNVMCLPTSAAAVIAAENRVNPISMSLFASRLVSGSGFDKQLVDKIIATTDVKIPRNATPWQKVDSLMGTHDALQKSFQQSEKLLVAEFTGRLQIAKVNCFKVYGLVMQVWKEIATKFAVPDGSGIPPEFEISNGSRIPSSWSDMEQEVRQHVVTSGIYYGAGSALHVEREMKHVKKTADWEEFVSVRVIRDAIVDIWGGKMSSDFVWSHV